MENIDQERERERLEGTVGREREVDRKLGGEKLRGKSGATGKRRKGKSGATGKDGGLWVNFVRGR